MPEDQEPSDEELEKRLRSLLGEEGPSPIKNPLHDLPDDEEPDPLELKLAELEQKAGRIRDKNPLPEPLEWERKLPPKPKKELPSGAAYRGMGFGLAAAYALLGPVIVGWGIGYLIDKPTGGNRAQMIGSITGIFFGFVAFIVVLYKGFGQNGAK